MNKTRVQTYINKVKGAERYTTLEYAALALPLLDILNPYDAAALRTAIKERYDEMKNVTGFWKQAV